MARADVGIHVSIGQTRECRNACCGQRGTTGVACTAVSQPWQQCRQPAICNRAGAVRHDPPTGSTKGINGRSIGSQSSAFGGVQVIDSAGAGEPQHVRVDRAVGQVNEKLVDGCRAVYVGDSFT